MMLSLRGGCVGHGRIQGVRRVRGVSTAQLKSSPAGDGGDRPVAQERGAMRRRRPRAARPKPGGGSPTTAPGQAHLLRQPRREVHERQPSASGSIQPSVAPMSW